MLDFKNSFSFVKRDHTYETVFRSAQESFRLMKTMTCFSRANMSYVNIDENHEIPKD